ncbi:MAG: hypothetical protein ACMUIA_08165 [bacterium]
MSTSCPHCNALNPYGAEICGDCGSSLATESNIPEPIKTEEPSNSSQRTMKQPAMEQLPAGGERLSGLEVLSQGKKRRPPIPVQMLSGTILALGLVMLGGAVLILKMGNSFFLPIPPFLPYLAYPRLVPILLLSSGVCTLMVAHGLSRLKKWGLYAFMGWVLAQVALAVMARINHYQLGFPYYLVIFGEILIAPLLWRISYRFIY